MGLEGMMMIRKLFFATLVATTPLLFSTPAQASADSTCYPDWKVKQTQMFGCSGMALLSPGNDTRINLLMLLSDRHGDVGVSHATSYDAMDRRGDAQPFDYGVFSLALGQKPPEDENANSYGDRCISNASGQTDFEAALVAAKQKLRADEVAELVAARNILQPECGDGAMMRPLVEAKLTLISSQAGKDFASYLLAAASFYDGDFGGARQMFSALAKGQTAWPKEAALYMLGRVELNIAMSSAFDDYGYPVEDVRNSAELAAAELAFKSYLKSYPQGSYATSASGLLRKVYWLAKDNDKLLAEYVSAFKRKNRVGSNVSLADLVQELDVKLGEKLDIANVSDPMILAMLDLKAMRYSDDPDMQGDDKPLTRAQLEAQRPRFAGHEALYTYLLAAHAFYVDKNADAALRLLPTQSEGSGYFTYSQRALRALALDSKGDANARDALSAVLDSAKKPFQRGTMELALAMHDERNKGLDRLFAADSPVTDPEVRERLLRYNAGPALLRKQAASKTAAKQEREVALYTLLYKDITRGAYKDFLRDQALIPAGTRPKPQDDYTAPVYTNIAIFKWAGSKDGFACPSLTTLATALSGAPKDAPSLMCLAEFARNNGFDTGASWPDLPQSLDILPPKDQLGGTASLFPGKPFSRLEIYKGVIADPVAPATSKAYALYRAVYCYAPGGYNSCGGVEVPKAQRKAWYNQLKKAYPASPWATKLKYYW
jgi:hypothetical protein